MSAPTLPPHAQPLRVLQRYGDLCFVDKPAGQLAHNSAWAGPREHTLVDEVEAVLGAGWHPLHRLDRQTSGVVAFAPREHIARLQEALAHADKRYWALVRGHLRDRVEVDHPIVDDEDGVRVARPAQSVVTPLLRSSVERCSLVEVQLLTGRRHQARRHLKHLSHPVLGDATHGKGPLNREYRARHGLSRMALHAHTLALDGRCATSPLPDDLRAVVCRLFPLESMP
jgi:tRNA pseudouridine65 synthase